MLNLQAVGMAEKQERQPLVVLDKESKAKDDQQQGNPGQIILDKADLKKDFHSKN